MTVGVESSACVWPQGPQSYEKQHWKLPRSPACMAAFARMHILWPRMGGCLHHDGAAGDWPSKANWVADTGIHDDGWDIRHDEWPRRSRGRSSCRMSRYFIYVPILLPPGNFSMRRNTVPGTTFLYRRVRSDGTEQNTSLLKTKQIMRDDIEVQYYIFVPAGTVWLTKVLNRIRYWSK